MEDKEIAELFADGEMKVKNTWIWAYDSESGRKGWISMDNILSDLIKNFDECKEESINEVNSQDASASVRKEEGEESLTSPCSNEVTLPDIKPEQGIPNVHFIKNDMPSLMKVAKEAVKDEKQEKNVTISENDLCKSCGHKRFSHTSSFGCGIWNCMCKKFTFQDNSVLNLEGGKNENIK